jgi:hypothetical protein
MYGKSCTVNDPRTIHFLCTLALPEDCIQPAPLYSVSYVMKPATLCAKVTTIGSTDLPQPFLNTTTMPDTWVSLHRQTRVALRTPWSASQPVPSLEHAKIAIHPITTSARILEKAPRREPRQSRKVTPKLKAHAPSCRCSSQRAARALAMHGRPCHAPQREFPYDAPSRAHPSSIRPGRPQKAALPTTAAPAPGDATRGSSRMRVVPPPPTLLTAASGSKLTSAARPADVDRPAAWAQGQAPDADRPPSPPAARAHAPPDSRTPWEPCTRVWVFTLRDPRTRGTTHAGSSAHSDGRVVAQLPGPIHPALQQGSLPVASWVYPSKDTPLPS